MDAGIARHARLICALIDAGRLLQGVADAAFDELGADRRTLTVNALTTWLCRIARAACRSWDTRFNEVSELPERPPLRELPFEVELRTPAGFAFYGVYREAYFEAAG